jgi:hypothetical protein
MHHALPANKILSKNKRLHSKEYLTSSEICASMTTCSKTITTNVVSLAMYKRGYLDELDAEELNQDETKQMNANWYNLLYSKITSQAGNRIMDKQLQA